MKNFILIGTSLALGYFLNSKTGKQLLGWTKEKLKKSIDDLIINDESSNQSKNPEEE